ncbi:receptor activity-modifying protein 1-like [Neoarius graeffei]|uniref:receptor activity-modifying protein 1-like n=1 Tax=Neoarius graeffei TaxID=443677 RepID=UPI00298C1AD7|nr:receptor activity-modifying protein 1-like [Neoarius graeffei]XP_060784853.1 receptor activity-modifying protein 1-like [Neoarius graeffei]
MAHIVTSLISATLIMCLAFTVAQLDGSDASVCDRATFDSTVHSSCVSIYKEFMAATNYQDECPWPSTQRYYNNLDYCVTMVGNITSCNEPSLKNKIFLDIHHTYFFHCPFQKDPDVLVLLLFTLPCIIITFIIPFFCTYITHKE